MKTTPVLVALILLCFSAGARPITPASPVCDKMSSALAPFVEQGMFQGNVLLAKVGKVQCQLSAGYEDDTQSTPITNASRFPIASLSKPIVAALTLRLEKAGILNLDQSLASYLPDFSATWADQVTLHHLLANRSGLPGHFSLPGWPQGKYSRTLPRQELLSDIAALDLSFSPGSHYQYTNLGWLLLGAVIEQTTGKSLRSNLQAHLFEPLGMSRTGLVYGSSDSLVAGLRWAAAGGWRNQTDLHMQIFNEGAGLYSTTGDLLAFLDALHQGSVLTPSQNKRIFSDSTPYGWRVETLALGNAPGKPTHNYDGQLLGHSSIAYQILDDDVSLIILNNTGMGFAHKNALAQDILSAYYGIPFPDRMHTPSLKLHQALLAGTWQRSLEQLQFKAILSTASAVLVRDLAQQLDWRGEQQKAIDLYAWLVSSFPDNARLEAQLGRLCAQHSSHQRCGRKDSRQVGMTVLPLKDPDRNAWRNATPRPITTHLFYPTKAQNTEPFLLGPATAPLFNAGKVVHNAPPSKAKHPLVLMSHGTGGSAPQMLWLADALVREGYLVAAVNHHGNTAIEREKYPEGYLLWWERARDLKVVQEHLFQDVTWGDLIDQDKVAVIGFSLGGYTTLSALGGITDKRLFDEYCQQASDDFSCEPQAEFKTVLEAFKQVQDSPQVQASNARQHQNYRIPGIRAGIVIAPAIVHTFTPDSLKGIHTPTLFIVGSEDQIAPPRPNAEYADSLLPHSQLAVIEHGRHYSFLARCTKKGKDVLTQLCDDPSGAPREGVHRKTIEKILPFLRQYLH